MIRSGEPLPVVVEATGVLRDSACALHLYNALGQPVATLDSAAPARGDEHYDWASGRYFAVTYQSCCSCPAPIA